MNFYHFFTADPGLRKRRAPAPGLRTPSFLRLGLYFCPRFSFQSNCGAITGTTAGAAALPGAGRLPASPTGPAPREPRTAPAGPILTKGPFRPLLKLNAMEPGHRRVSAAASQLLSRLSGRFPRRDPRGNNGAADLLRVCAPPISTCLTHPSSGHSNLPVARPAPPRLLIRSRAAERSLSVCGRRCQSGAL